MWDRYCFVEYLNKIDSSNRQDLYHGSVIRMIVCIGLDIDVISVFNIKMIRCQFKII